MTSLVRHLEQLTVTATSPDGKIKVALRDEGRILCGFRGKDDFRAYGAGELSRQLGAMFSSLEEGRRRGVRQAYEASGWDVEDEAPHWDAQRRRYRAALSGAEVRGRSRGGLVLFKASGDLENCQVKVHPKALEELEADQFLFELHSAYAALRLDRKLKRNELKREHLPR
ncbi:MAG: hypothetical protein ACRDXX_12140 [Stackebrandtia sp.]